MIELHKLSDFTGEDAVEVVCDLLSPVGEIVGSLDQDKLKAAKNNLAAVGLMFKANKAATLEIFARLSREPVDPDHLDAGDIASATFQLAGDKDFFNLFGYQSKTSPSSGSAPENTEGEASEDSLDTAPPDRKTGTKTKHIAPT